MALPDFEISIPDAELSELTSASKLSDAAEALLPEVLRQVGERIAEDVWERGSEIIGNGKASPFADPNGRAEYVRKSGLAFIESVSPKIRSQYHALIVDSLRCRMT